MPTTNNQQLTKAPDISGEQKFSFDVSGAFYCSYGGMSMQKVKFLSVRVDQKSYDRIHLIADREGVTVSHLVRNRVLKSAEDRQNERPSVIKYIGGSNE